MLYEAIQIRFLCRRYAIVLYTAHNGLRATIRMFFFHIRYIVLCIGTHIIIIDRCILIRRIHA